MLKDRKFNAFLQNALRAEAANTAMLLKNNLLTPNRTLSPFNNFLEREVTTQQDNSHCAELANHGTPGIWVGHAHGHSTGTLKRLF